MTYFGVLPKELLWKIYIKCKGNIKLGIFEPLPKKMMNGDFDPLDLSLKENRLSTVGLLYFLGKRTNNPDIVFEMLFRSISINECVSKTRYRFLYSMSRQS